MTNVRRSIEQISEALEGSRIAKDTRQELDNRLGSLASRLGKIPASVDLVPNPMVDPNWYTGRYYWDANDRAEARLETPATVAVRAVNLDYMTDYDVENHRSPSAWSPRVELTMAAGDHILTGDLNPREARRLAMQLLAAADLHDRS